MVPEDEPFVYSSWLKSFRASKTNFGQTGRIYHANQSAKISSILERDTTRAIVACDPEDPEHIFAHIVFEVFHSAIVIHYIYVKESYRRLGLAHALLEFVILNRRPGTALWCSHYPANADIYTMAEKLGIEYDPNLVGGMKDERETEGQ